MLIVTETNEDRPDLPLQLRVDPTKDRCNLSRGEVHGESLDSLHVVVDPHAAIGRVRGWSDLDQGAGIKRYDLSTTLGVSCPIPLCKKLEDLNSSLGLGRNPILDVERLESLGPSVLAAEEERAKLPSDHSGK